MRGGVTDAGRRTNKRQTVKIELLSQWKLEAEFRKYEFAFQNIDLRCFVARQFLSQIYALFWRTFFRPKKYGGVPKMTIIRYELI